MYLFDLYIAVVDICADTVKVWVKYFGKEEIKNTKIVTCRTKWSGHKVHVSSRFVQSCKKIGDGVMFSLF